MPSFLFLPQYPATTHSLTTSRTHVTLHTFISYFHYYLNVQPQPYHPNLGKPLNLTRASYVMKTLTLPCMIYLVLACCHHHRLLKTHCCCHSLQTAPPFLRNHLLKQHPLLNQTTQHGLLKTQHDLFLTHAHHPLALLMCKKLQGLLLTSK